MTEIIIGLISALGGGTMQYFLSSKFMPKKEEREADQVFIDTLLERINVLEARIDNQTLSINTLIKENAELKSELEHIKKDKGGK